LKNEIRFTETLIYKKYTSILDNHEYTIWYLILINIFMNIILRHGKANGAKFSIKKIA
jgi:hypothetical protein